MENDYLRELGHLGLIARMKRLSDRMLYSIRELYADHGFDIEPNWHFVFLYLKDRDKGTMSEMAEAFGLSQPAVVKILGKMKKLGYIDVAEDSSDMRKRQLCLSDKALRHLPDFEKVWQGGEKSIKKMLNKDKQFLKSLEQLEDHLALFDFRGRVLDQTKKR